MKRSAQTVAIVAHDSISQKRKYTLEPYWHHCKNVAYLVSLVTNDKEIIDAAWLHDTIEDVKKFPYHIGTMAEFIYRNFGERIFLLVDQMTDKTCLNDGNREQRKIIDRQRWLNADPDAQTIKLADLIDNCKDIMTHDKKFGAVYLKEKELLLPYLTNGNESLFNMATDMVSRYK